MRKPITGFTSFQAIAFDLVDRCLTEGEPLDCRNPALAIQTAMGQWKVFGHAGAVALSRTSHFDKDKPDDEHVLRRFGQVPARYLGRDIGD